jgi:hypothetical protein
MTTNKPIWLTAWLYACAIWMNIEQGWRMFRWDYKTWLFLMSLDGHASHTAAYWWDCLSANLEPIRPR